MSGPNQQKDLSNMKKSLTLDFNHVKKNSMSLALSGSMMLDSPDINKLNLPTPEIENMLLNTTQLNTPTPSLLYHTRPVTEEQESFATGFVNALNNLHNSNSQASDSSSVYTDLEQPNLQMFTATTIKEEPQTVPNINNSPPMSPVDMEYQERMKLERKRQRNRLAASKCRSRKLERISKLEDKVKHLKSENVELASLVNQLKEHVGLLKVEVMQHCHAGCQILGSVN